MREIKFRVWDAEEKNFIYFDTIDSILSKCAEVYRQRSVVGFEQFTGLHDKNGKEVYEWDIVKDEYGQVNEIKFLAGSFWFNWIEMPQGVNQVEKGEVIGNIHENPELLND